MAELDCRSVACVAGHASRFFELGAWFNAVKNSKKYFGLTDHQSARLFTPQGWCDDHTTTPKQAAAVIEHLVKTGKVSWSHRVMNKCHSQN